MVVGFVWQAGITRFLASVEVEFPVYFQHSVFILGDWGWGDWGSVCVIKGPSSASTQV